MKIDGNIYLNNSPKRLLIVIGSLMVGGTETFLVRFLSYLAAQNWSIEVFTLAYEKGDLAPCLEKQGVKVTEVLSSKDKNKLSRFPKPLERLCRIFLSTYRLNRCLRKENNQAILHFYLPEAYVLGMIAAFMADFSGPRLMSRRSLNNYQKKRPWVAWLERKMHAYLTLSFGNSARVVKQLEQEGIPSEKIKLIYNGLPLQTSVRPSRIDDETLKFVIVANLIPYKGHEDLLNAFGIIKDQIKQPWELICIGRDQGILDKLKTLAATNGIDQNIIWLGERKDVAQLLPTCDIGLLTSHEEGFSNAILECMAAGLPMIVTDVGGNAEAVLHNKTGLVVPPKKPEALGHAILNIISDKERMKNFGLAARERVIEQFNLKKCVDEHIIQYEKIIKKIS